MGAPLVMPSGAVPAPSVWRAISSLGFFRRLLGIPREQPAPASAGPVRLGPGASDRDGPDTSLTQAELEVLK